MGLFTRRSRYPELVPDDTVSQKMEALANELTQAAADLHDLVAEMRLRKEIEAQHAEGAGDRQVSATDNSAHVEVERRGKLSIDIHTLPEDDAPEGAS